MKQNFKLALKRFGFVACVGLTTSVTSTLVVAQSSADPNKVLRYVFPVAETGFDPAGVHDLYSAHVNGSIFETLFTYDYLASPAKLVPRTAVALPEVSADGLTYTIRLQKGIYFAADQTETQNQLRKLSRLNSSYWGWRKGFNPLLLKSHPTFLPSEPGASENVT